MEREMEIPSPSSYSNWLLDIDDTKNVKWTHEENKLFENAISIFDKDTPDRWHKVASMIPGKTVMDVIKQYKALEEDVSDIEAGLIPIPGHFSPSFNHQEFDVFKRSYGSGSKRTSSDRPSSDLEMKKGAQWTENEHK